MISCSLSNLMKKVDCRYTLVIVTAKRARMLTEQKQVSPKDEYNPADNSQRVVDIAAKEIMSGRVSYLKRPVDETKEIVHQDSVFFHDRLDEFTDIDE